MVTNVHLSDNELVGPLPSSFCRLRYLKEFDIDGSFFTGALPEWMPACWPELEELDVSFNLFSGTIPPRVFAWKRIKEFQVRATTNPLPLTLASSRSTTTNK